VIGVDIGGRLRLAREQRGWSLSDAARVTKLSTAVIRDIERNDFDRLPGGMYRKAYLRTVAAEVGLDPSEIAAHYDALQQQSAESPATDGAPAAADPLLEHLTPSRRRNAFTLAFLATLSAAWLVFAPDFVPLASRPDRPAAETEPPSRPAPVNAVRASASPGVSGLDRAAAAVASPVPLKIHLTTIGRCWVAADSDGERVVYGLMEPGTRIVVEGRRRILLRLGDAGAVRVSINDGPDQTPGADGEVVELDVTSDAVQGLRDGADL
jgi:transcriptional regulator with XRE-family HTH domain